MLNYFVSNSWDQRYVTFLLVGSLPSYSIAEAVSIIRPYSTIAYAINLGLWLGHCEPPARVYLTGR